MVSKGMVEAVLTWLEHTHAIGFTRDEISELADEYLEVQGVTPPKPVINKDHFLMASSTNMRGNMIGFCACGFKGVLSGVQRHIEDANEPPAISTYLPPENDTHVVRGDSIGMGVHERWYCSCGEVYRARVTAEWHRDMSNGSY